MNHLAIPYTLAMLLTAPWLSAADPVPVPLATVLVARNVPAGPGQPEVDQRLSIVGSMVDEATCWQVAKFVGMSVPTQVFYCVTPSSLMPEPSLKKVPPVMPKGKVVRL
jgi:hypothetical protein